MGCFCLLFGRTFVFGLHTTKTEKILKTFKDVTTADCAESHEYTEVNFDVTITKNN